MTLDELIEAAKNKRAVTGCFGDGTNKHPQPASMALHLPAIVLIERLPRIKLYEKPVASEEAR